MPRICSVIRVFTRDGTGGNHLGVVEDLAGLDDGKMQAIAADLGFSETIFIDASRDDVPTIRIFTPEVELPFAGHPLVGAAWVMLEKGTGAVNRLRCGIGDVTFRAVGEVVWVDVPMVVGNAEATDRGFAAQVGVADPVDVWRVKMPLDYRMVELATFDEVAGVKPDTAALPPANGLTVFARDGNWVRMRFFIPEAGIEEDPATGSAAVALATMLAARGETHGDLVIHQGEEIGHPSRINLKWSGQKASIGGAVAADQPRELSL